MSAQPKRILFLPVPLRGHAVPLMRLAEHFVRMDGFEVHIWLGGSWQELAPKGAILHEDFGMDAVETWNAAYAECFEAVSSRPSFYSTWAGMITAFAGPKMAATKLELELGAVRMVQKLAPHIVVADAGLQTGGRIPAFCARHCGAEFYALCCPGRPLHFGRLMMGMLFRHFRELSKVRHKYAELDQALEKETGPPPPIKAMTWTWLLPGCRSFVRQGVSAHEVYVGPFLPVPSETPPMRDTEGLSGDLQRWLDNDGSPEPVVYVAFGTLAHLDHGQLQCLARGLAAGPWRVLWALREAQQKELPKDVRNMSTSDRWRLETLVPQPKVLAHHNVQCFVTHCGQNSVHEALAVGVPMVCLPIFCDQFEWAANICDDRKVGIQLDKTRLSSPAVTKAVAMVIEDESMRSRARGCRSELLQLRQSVATLLAKDLDDGECLGVPLAAGLIAGTLDRCQVGACQPTCPHQQLNSITRRTLVCALRAIGAAAVANLVSDQPLS